MVSIDDFERQVDCDYKNEHYSVRDNGAIFRHPVPNKAVRKHDNYWTFGKVNESGYLQIANEIVHRIVAYAFLGAPPTPQHIVDHKDTNRQNNRPENLRWLTKLENILNNPITVKKIIYRCGSIEAFLENPSILNKYKNDDPNFGWMRAVSREEAQISWDRISNWAKQKSKNKKSSGEKWGEWIFNDENDFFNFDEEHGFVNAITPNALQENWETPCQFPCCPKMITNDPLENYALNLKVGAVFSRNENAILIVDEFKMSTNKESIVVLSKDNLVEETNPWFLTQIILLDNCFLHTHLGSFNEKIKTHNFFTLAQELTWK